MITRDEINAAVDEKSSYILRLCLRVCLSRKIYPLHSAWSDIRTGYLI
jgi:hypothetical protein